MSEHTGRAAPGVASPAPTMTTTTTPPVAAVSTPPPPTAATPATPGADRRRLAGLTGLAEHLVLGLLSFLPLLVVRTGVVIPDTKTYLYLDPGRFVRQVSSMWDPTVALGTVTHEYIGYLLPMGPFFWTTSALHVPVWMAQRLWMGTILFAAGAGILYLCRVLALREPGRLVAALAYMLTPYFLQYSGRISVLLLPWAGLPWMVAFVVLAMRRGGWRYPALFAVVVALVSGINASSIIYVGIAPVLWLVYAAVVERDGSWGRALSTALKVGVLTLLVCLWWIAGLAVEAAYGVNVLKFTETIPSTTHTSSASEVLRGLGYWYFYGQDRLGPWTQSSVIYTQQVWLIAASFAVPVLAFCSAVLVRWRHRAYFVLLVVVGTVLSVGAHPFTSPTPFGHLLRTFMTQTTAGLAMRSTDRATPVLILGLAMLLGSGVTAVWQRVHWAGVVTAVVVGGLVIANNPALFNGDAEQANGFTQPATLPPAELAVAAHLNATHPGTRVLEIPGQDFAAQRWGDTVDSPMAAVLTRPFAIHEQQVMGSEATADTLYALDQPIQAGIESWNALGPMARLISAGDVLVQYDTAYERYGTPQPQILYPELHPTPPGLSHPVAYGTAVPNIAPIPMLNEQDEASTTIPATPPLVSYTVANPRPLVRAESNSGAIVVAGDATGLQNMAAAGLLDTTSSIYYAGTLDTHPGQLGRLMAGGASLVMTDTDRKEGFRWDTVTANAGYTENATENPAKTDLSDSPLALFPGAPVGAHTLATDVGAVDVTASNYGNSVSYTPENRAYAAVDGNLDTSWQTGIFESDPAGRWWQIHLPAPVTEHQVTLVQTLNGDTTRWITRATLTFDGKHPVTVHLGPSSRTAAGQVVAFSARRFATMRITIDATSNDHVAVPAASEVGFAEVEIPGVHVTEVITMPTDLLTAAGAASAANRLTLLMSRQRVAPYPPRSDPEPVMIRSFTLPTARTFTVTGTASISSLIPDDAIDRLVGRPGATGSGIVAYSSGRLPGDLSAGAAAALDANLHTAWQPGFEAPFQAGSWLEYNLPRPITFDHLNLEVVADGRHSVPTSLTVATESGSRHVTLPPIADGRTPGSVVAVPVAFPAVHGQRIRVTVTGARLESSSNFFAPRPIALPLGIAEVGIPGLTMPPVPAELPGGCRSDLLSVDGQPVPVQVTGTTATALANGEVRVEPCGAAARGISLGPGPHTVETSIGHQTGWQVDQLMLDSAPGGAPAGPPVATQPGAAPAVHLVHQNRTSMTLRVSGASAPFELVLGESVNAGWSAVVSPGPGAPPGARSVDLGRSELIDGFANGWPVSTDALARLGALGAAGSGDLVVTLRWTPQSKVNVALVISGLTFLACLVVGFAPRRRWWRRSGRGRHAKGANGTTPADGHDPGAIVVDGWPGDPQPPPELASPLASDGRRPHWPTIVVVALVTGAVAAAISSPLIGVAAGLAVGAATALRHARGLTSLVAVGLVAAAGASVVVGQATHPLFESADWPAHFESAAVLAWMAVVFLGADAVVETARRLAARRRTTAPGTVHMVSALVPFATPPPGPQASASPGRHGPDVGPGGPAPADTAPGDPAPADNAPGDPAPADTAPGDPGSGDPVLGPAFPPPAPD